MMVNESPKKKENQLIPLPPTPTRKKKIPKPKKAKTKIKENQYRKNTKIQNISPSTHVPCNFFHPTSSTRHPAVAHTQDSPLSSSQKISQPIFTSCIEPRYNLVDK